MEKKWEEIADGKTLDEQWHELYKRNKKKRSPHKAIWNGGGLINQEKILPILFKELNIKTMVDLGCADHFWLSKVDMSDIDYMGIDIIPELIEQNRMKFPDKTFICDNVVNYDIPKKDFIFIRDVFTHLNFEDCLKIIENIKKSDSTYLMASSSSFSNNINTRCLILYPRNLMVEPFNFPKPFKKIKDKGKDGYYMGIWKINEL